MSRLSTSQPSRIDRDERSGAIRNWFDPSFRPANTDATHGEIARQVLADSADMFKWNKSLPDMADRSVVTGPSSTSVRLFQEFKKLPVDASDIVVNFDAQGHLHSIYNGYHYDIPESLNPADVKVKEA